MTQPLLIVIASSYRSGTSDDPERIDANLRAMTDMALRVLHAGHLPVGGEWLALPLIQHAGLHAAGDAVFDEICSLLTAARFSAAMPACARAAHRRGPMR